jgi:putative Mg2+ transporter-C (MgtC) family protein
MFIFTPEDLIKLLIAVLLGGIIGFEREAHNKAAGLRTITLITVGAALFTLLSAKGSDPATSRISSNIVTGVGFIGAGAIMFSEGKVKGLTTASSIWVSASIGMAIGLGEYILGASVTLLVVIVLGLFTRLDMFMDKVGKETRTYEITYPPREEKYKELIQLFTSCNLRVRSTRRMKQGELLIVLVDGVGRTKNHACLADKLLADAEIRDLKY